MSYSRLNRTVKLSYKIIDLIHRCHLLTVLLVKIEFDIACEYLIFLTECTGDDGECI